MTYSFHAQISIRLDDEKNESAVLPLNLNRIQEALAKNKLKVRIDSNAFGAFQPIITIDARKKEEQHG